MSLYCSGLSTNFSFLIIRSRQSTVLPLPDLGKDILHADLYAVVLNVEFVHCDLQLPVLPLQKWGSQRDLVLLQTSRLPRSLSGNIISEPPLPVLLVLLVIRGYNLKVDQEIYLLINPIRNIPFSSSWLSAEASVLRERNIECWDRSWRREWLLERLTNIVRIDMNESCLEPGQS